MNEFLKNYENNNDDGATIINTLNSATTRLSRETVLIVCQ